MGRSVCVPSCCAWSQVKVCWRGATEEMLCYVVEGEGSLTVGDEVLAVSAGDFAAAAPGEVRGLQAEQRMTVLWLQLGGAGGQHE